MQIKYIVTLVAALAGLAGLCTAGCARDMGRSFDAYDANGDGRLTEQEFYGSADNAGVYAGRDRDDNGVIDRQEYDEMGYDDDDFGDWDADADDSLDENEFYEGAFAYFDEDGDGLWDNDEWDDADEQGFFDV